MYEIIGRYQLQAPEVIDTAETKEDAEYLVNEYRLAYGTGWSIRIRKIK